MLISLIEVVTCENPNCSEFATMVELPRGARTYYCQTCGKVSRVRGVDARVLASPEKFKEFLLSLHDETDSE